MYGVAQGFILGPLLFNIYLFGLKLEHFSNDTFQSYYDFFQVNWLVLTWLVPTVLPFDNGDTITNPYDIATTFNNYFASISETTKKSIKYSFFRLSFQWKY